MPAVIHKPRKNAKKYALVWWVNSKTSNVIALNAIPTKDRHVDSITKVLWEENGKTTKIEAKVIAISSKYYSYLSVSKSDFFRLLIQLVCMPVHWFVNFIN